MLNYIDYGIYLAAVDYMNQFHAIPLEPSSSSWWDSLPPGMQQNYLVGLGYSPSYHPTPEYQQQVNSEAVNG